MQIFFSIVYTGKLVILQAYVADCLFNMVVQLLHIAFAITKAWHFLALHDGCLLMLLTVPNVLFLYLALLQGTSSLVTVSIGSDAIKVSINFITISDAFDG